MLHARFNDDVLPVGIVHRAVGVRVVNALVDHDVHAADGIDQADQAVEVDFGVVGDADARELGGFANGGGGTAVVVGGVELVRAVAVDVDHGVTRDGNERGLVLRRIDTHDDVRIRTRTVFVAFALSLIRADEQHVERLVIGSHGLELVVDGEDFLFGLVAAVQGVLYIAVPNGERRAAANGHDEHRRENAECDMLAALRFTGRLRRVRGILTGILRRTLVVVEDVVRNLALGSGRIDGSIGRLLRWDVARSLRVPVLMKCHACSSTASSI